MVSINLRVFSNKQSYKFGVALLAVDLFFSNYLPALSLEAKNHVK